MMDNETPTTHAGWEPLPHEHLPRPTYFPAGMAMGVTFFFWGLITSWVILAVGVGLFASSLAGWITEIRHERKRD
jgi:hypothetical protein